MNRSASLFLALLLTTGIARASTTESLGGRLETGAAGEVVLTLDVAPSQLARLADKEGQEATHDGPALAELIRERFHYLLRLRVAGQAFAPTSVALALPADGAPLPAVLSLTATWAGVPSGRMQVVTQTDVPNYRVELEVVDQRALAAPAAKTNLPSRWRMLGEGMSAGLARLVPDGIVQLLFVLGLYFSARAGRELILRLGLFCVVHALALWLGASGIIAVTLRVSHGIDFAVGLSLIAIAVGNCLGRRLSAGLALALFAGAGGLHGLGMVRAFTGVRSVPAAILGLELALLAVVGVAALLSGARRQHSWDRPEIAVPASFVIGLGGVAWTLGRAQGVLP